MNAFIILSKDEKNKIEYNCEILEDEDINSDIKKILDNNSKIVKIEENDFKEIINHLNSDPYQNNYFDSRLDYSLSNKTFVIKSKRNNDLKTRIFSYIPPFVYWNLNTLSWILILNPVYNGRIYDENKNVIVNWEWYLEDCDKRKRWAEQAAEAAAKKNQGKKNAN